LSYALGKEEKNALYADKIRKLEKLISINPYENEMCRPCDETVSYKYVPLDDDAIIQYYIDEADESVNISC